jgi:hypothetical protein
VSRASPRLAQDRPRLAGEFEQRPGLHPLQLHDGLGIEGFIRRQHVHHLAAHHPFAAGGPGQPRYQLAADGGGGMGGGIGQDLEGEGQEPIAGKHRRRLVELHMGRGLAPAQDIVIHAGQVVMDKGIGMQHLDGRPRPHRRGDGETEKNGRGARTRKGRSRLPPAKTA